MTWYDFSATTVAVLAGRNVRAIAGAVAVYDAVTSLPLPVRVNGADVPALEADGTGHVVFQAEALVVRMEALGYAELVESDQQKIAKAGVTPTQLIGTDTDGVPYFDPSGVTDGTVVGTDTDGVPFFIPAV